MKTYSSHIRLFRKNEFSSAEVEGIRHIKVLPYLSVVQSVEGSYEFSLGKSEPTQTGDGGFFIAPANLRQTIVHHINKESRKMLQ